MANIKSFPNNQDEFIGAEYVMKWLHGRTSGVFGASGNAAVAPVLDTMAVTVSDGNGWLANDNADGIVWWNDTEAVTGSKLQLSVDMASATFSRIDRVVVSWETTNYVALPTISILKGTPSANPAAPALTRNNLLRQISLAKITIPAGTTAITSAMITDERLNTSVCGLVTAGMGVDTSVMDAEFNAWFSTIKTTLSGDVAGNLLNMIEQLEQSKADSGLTVLETTTVTEAAEAQAADTVANYRISANYTGADLPDFVYKSIKQAVTIYKRETDASIIIWGTHGNYVSAIGYASFVFLTPQLVWDRIANGASSYLYAEESTPNMSNKIYWQYE